MMPAGLNWKPAVILALAAYLGLIIWALASPHKQLLAPNEQPPEEYFNNPLGNPPGIVDRLLLIDTSDLLAHGELDKVVPAQQKIGLELAAGGTDRFPRTGTWTTEASTTEFPFTELIPSLNVILPPGTGARMDVRVRSAASGQWSPWLYFGSFGQAPIQTRVTSCEDGQVHIDNLVLKKGADAWQARLRLFSFILDDSTTPRLRRLAISYSGVIEDPVQRQKLSPPSNVPDDWGRKINVAFLTTPRSPSALRPQICSPTSTTMVMSYCGVDRQLAENALAIYDCEYHM